MMNKLLLGLAALVMSVNVYAANLVVNGGFEDPVLQSDGWMTFYGQNGPGDPCPLNNAPANCNDGTLVPGWYAWWTSSVIDGTFLPARIEIQRGDVGGVVQYDAQTNGGNQRVELDTHHRLGEDADNNIVLFQFVQVCHGRPYTLNYAWKSRTATIGDNDMNVIVDNIISTSSGQTHSLNNGWGTGEIKFVASDVLVPVAFFSTGMSNTLGMYVDEVSLNGDSPEECVNVCEVGKPSTLTVMYNGTSGSINSQTDDYARPEVQTADFPSPATILVLDDNGNKKQKLIGVYNDVYIGDLITTEPLKNGKVPPKTTFVIIDPSTGETVQTVHFHTSCSQPLTVGDKFGGITVRGFTN